MNPLTNAVIIGIAALLFYVAGLPWVAIAIMGLRIAWWIFSEIMKSRVKKRNSLQAAPAADATPHAYPDSLPPQPTPLQHDVISFCTECGAGRAGAGLYCVECGGPFPR